MSVFFFSQGLARKAAILLGLSNRELNSENWRMGDGVAEQTEGGCQREPESNH